VKLVYVHEAQLIECLGPELKALLRRMRQGFFPAQFESDLEEYSSPPFVPVSIVALGMFQCLRSISSGSSPGRFVRPRGERSSLPSRHASNCGRPRVRR